MGQEIGARRWAIAEGYIPGWSHGPDPQMTSHEAVCLLNSGDQDAQIAITIFYSDREPAGPYRLTVPARRTRHVRFNDLDSPEPIPHGTDYASVIESDVPIVVQHTRLDSRQAENALMTVITNANWMNLVRIRLSIRFPRRYNQECRAEKGSDKAVEGESLRRLSDQSQPLTERPT